jgi:hypothetical protein
MDVQVTNPIHAHATNDVKSGNNLITSIKSAANACLPKAEPRKRPSFNCTSPTVPLYKYTFMTYLSGYMRACVSWPISDMVCCVVSAGRSSSLRNLFSRSKSSSTPEELQEPGDDGEVEEVENPMHMIGHDGMRVMEGA